MPRRQHRPGLARPGFTLVELLVAVLLLAVGLLALAGTAGHLARALGASAGITTAAYQARSELERQRAALCAGAGPGDAAAPQPVAATVVLPPGVTVNGRASLTLRSEVACVR